MDDQIIPVKAAGMGMGKMMKRIICMLLCACLLVPAVSNTILASAAENSGAVTFAQLNDESVFLKQSQAHVCTLTSCAMMLRRAAMLSGDIEWDKITEQSVRKYAWVQGTGLKWNFKVSGFTVAHKSLVSKNELIKLLGKHPEGIVIYNPRKPHAVLVTDYTNGVFYCSDPSNDRPSGRYSISKASISVESASRIWYVKNAACLPPAKDGMEYSVDNLTYQVLSEEEKTVICTGVAKDTASVTVPDVVELDGEAYRVVQIADNAFAKSAKLKEITVGANVAAIGQKAFYLCKKLKKVTINAANLQEIGADAFASIHKKAQILILAEVQMETFANLLTGTSVPNTVMVGVQQSPDEVVNGQEK